VFDFRWSFFLAADIKYATKAALSPPQPGYTGETGNIFWVSQEQALFLNKE